MNRGIKHMLIVLLLAAVAGGWTIAVAQRPYGVERPYRVDQRQVEILLDRIETRSDSFRQNLGIALMSSSLDDTQREDFLNRYVADFEAATDRLRTDFRGGRSTAEDAQEVLNRGAYLDNFMGRHRLLAQAERDWRLLRTDLNLLARYYNVRTRWNDAAYRWTGATAVRGLTGTYRLNEAQSDNVRASVERAAGGALAGRRAETPAGLMRILKVPQMISIDRRGQTVTIASSLGRQFTVVADGQSRVENNARVRAAFNGDRLVVDLDGDRGRNYSVTFDPVARGGVLRVTRHITGDQLSRPIVINSFYDKTSGVARMNLFEERNNARRRPSYAGSFQVPNGTRLVAVLDTALETVRTREGDRFTMTVRSPNAYDGATLEGYVSGVDRAGPFSGRADLTLNFERIRMRGGRTYDFAANIVSVRMPGGGDVRVDEATIEEEDSQTEQTVARTGIGAAIGALIGAISGGGKGAAIGAAVGAGAGAGSVYVTGRDDLELPYGTEFVLDASAPGAGYTRR